MKHSIIVTLFLLLLGGAATLQAQDFTHHVPVLDSVLAEAWEIDREKGYGLREVREDVFVITDGTWQSAFVVTGRGVIVIDAPETYASKIQAAVAEVTSERIRMRPHLRAAVPHDKPARKTKPVVDGNFPTLLK